MQSVCLSLVFLSGVSTGAAAQVADPSGVGDGVPPGHMITEGDILVPEGFLTDRTCFATNLWSGGVVPYEFDGNVSSANRTAMLNAMAEWESVANVHFRTRNENDAYWLHIQNSSRNSSFVGMYDEGQVVNIHNWGSHYIIIHELGHALGYWHEQSRADRGSYVTIHYDRVREDCGDSGDLPCDYNFDIREDLGPLGSREYGPYDFDSIMHYGQCDFSNCADCGADPVNCRTISVKAGYESWQNLIGQRSHLSHFDALVMSFLYPWPGWRFVQGSYTGVEVGTFFMPYRTFQTGAALVPTGGTVWVQPGSYSAVGTYNRSMTVRAPLGAVTLGG